MHVSDVQAGQMLLLTAEDWIGRDIAWFENTGVAESEKRYWSHAVILLAHAPGDLVVWESTWPRVKQTPWKQWLRENTQPMTAVLLDAKHPWTAEANSRAWTVAQEHEGKHYDALHLAVLALWELGDRKIPPVPSIMGHVCSVFATIVAKAALELEDPRLAAVNPEEVDPNRVVELPWVGGVVEVEG